MVLYSPLNEFLKGGEHQGPPEDVIRSGSDHDQPPSDILAPSFCSAPL